MNSKKQVRQNFRDSVFKRDKHKCVFCDHTDNLDAHHITDRNNMPNGGYVVQNGISLCPNHHILVEVFHVSGGKDHTIGMHPDDLYAKIGSSYLAAVAASNRLK